MDWHLKNKWIFVAIVGFSLFVSILTVTASADTPAIPQWIRNNAKWWSEGTIGDSDFLHGIQYLAQQGIIQVQPPVKEITATNGNPSDTDRVMSIVVRFQNLANVPAGLSDFAVNSFQRVYESGQTASTTSILGGSTVPTATKVSPQVELIDLPSKDKSEYYQFVHAALENLAQNIEQQPTTDVNIDLYTGDGTLLNTLSYQKCNVNSYWVSTDSNKMDYRMASEDQAEFREFTNFICQGYHLIPGK
jgi:hypothetical protein